MNIPDSLKQDLRFACRGLWRQKAFSSVAILTLALGIAGTAAMFAVVRGVLLRPLPVHQQDRLIIAWKEAPASGSAQYPFGDTDIDALAEASRLLEKAAGVTRNGVGRSVIAGRGVSSYANVALVTGGFFDVLGVQPVLGRTLTLADENDGAEHVIVLSNGLWRRRYGASRGVIGRRVIVGEQPFTIVGVMPPDLDYPAGVEIWATTSSVPTSGPFGDAARREVNLIARLHQGVTLEQATSEITALARHLEAHAPANTPRGLVPRVRSFTAAVVGDVRAAMLALFAAVGLVLLIACANVANLLLMRAEARRGELAVRAALGAGRGRLVSQLLAESVLLTLVAGLVAVPATWWALQTLITLVPDDLPRVESVRFDATVLLFSIAVVFLTSVLAGVAPALVAMSADPGAELRSGGRGIIGSAGARGRRILVVGQVALALTIVAAAALLIQSVLTLQAVDLGLRAERLVLVDLHVPQERHASRVRHEQFLAATVAQLQAVPAIAAATPVNVAPFSGQGWDLPRFTAEGQNDDGAAANPSLNLESVHPNYFETFEIPILRGRPFAKTDRRGSRDVAIISDGLAAAMWPNGDAIGKRLKMGRTDSANAWYTVVGVAAETRYRDLASPRPTLYLPAAQFQMSATMLVLRTTASLELVAAVARERVAAVDADVRVMRVAPFSDMLDRPLARPRFHAVLLSLFGVAALLLSSVGLYAVMAAYVRQRGREIALRLALGATPSGVRRFVLAETMRLAGLGALLGVACAVSATRMLHSALHEVSALGSWPIVAAALLVAAAAAAASYLPVRRATRVDALTVLRSP